MSELIASEYENPYPLENAKVSRPTKFYFTAEVDTYWEDPPTISIYVHTLDASWRDYLDESMRDWFRREDVLDMIPLPARLPDHRFTVIGRAEYCCSTSYEGEYDSWIETEGEEWVSEPSEIGHELDLSR